MTTFLSGWPPAACFSFCPPDLFPKENVILYYNKQGYFCDRMQSQKFFLRTTEAWMAFHNLFFLALV
jgi:hypothetical protein